MKERRSPSVRDRNVWTLVFSLQTGCALIFLLFCFFSFMALWWIRPEETRLPLNHVVAVSFASSLFIASIMWVLWFFSSCSKNRLLDRLYRKRKEP